VRQNQIELPKSVALDTSFAAESATPPEESKAEQYQLMTKS
jgi:hypothetical protein